MAHKGGFQTPAQRSAVNGRDDRFAGSFNHVQCDVKIRPLRWLAKFGDVGTCDKG
jgi:hypothetical protein